MAEQRVTQEQLMDLLRERAKHLHSRNLVLVALPLQSAHQDARRLAQVIQADYVDFDCELIQQMQADDWEDHVNMEQRGTLFVGKELAAGWLKQVAQRIQSDRPLLIGNVNLAVRYALDVAGALYDSSEKGLCILAAGGRIQGQTLLIHNTLPQTGAGAAAYELIRPSEDLPQKPTQAVQDRLL
ncbi:MAG: hypothetical protein JW908_09110 [Anaerolineales bacterium]|nr:hypothetical protein [Anaerolineales bacterium]